MSAEKLQEHMESVEQLQEAYSKVHKYGDLLTLEANGWHC
jgi:hypothetical protein